MHAFASCGWWPMLLATHLSSCCSAPGSAPHPSGTCCALAVPLQAKDQETNTEAESTDDDEEPGVTSHEVRQQALPHVVSWHSAGRASYRRMCTSSPMLATCPHPTLISIRPPPRTSHPPVTLVASPPQQPSAFTEEDEDESAFVNCRPLVPLVPAAASQQQQEQQGGEAPAAAAQPASGERGHCGIL